MRGGESGLPGERVRQALVNLGTDSASAPDVPASVTARISAALRAAPTAPAHTTARRRSSRLRTILLLVGIAAAATGIAVAVALLLHTNANPRFPSGPTAEKIIVSTTPADTPKSVVTPP
jgi:hypothetical protein